MSYDIGDINNQTPNRQSDIDATPTRSEDEMNALATKFASVLRCFDFTAPTLLNTLSEKPIIQSSSETELSNKKVLSTQGVSSTQVTVADDICWD